MRDLPYLVIAAFLLLWGIVTASRAPLVGQPAPDATPSTLYPDQALPPDVAELPEPVPVGFTWPSELIYPGWTLQSIGPPTSCRTTDDFPTVKQWYWQHLPQAVVAEMEPGRHAMVANETIVVELRATTQGTSIEIRSRN